MAAFAPIEPRRVVDLVTERLEKTILEGDTLPFEKRSAAQPQIGRRSICEVLKVLETKGLLDVQKGIGAVVLQNDFEILLRFLTRNVGMYLRTDKASTQHVREQRWLVDSAMLERLASHPDKARLEQAKCDRARCEARSLGSARERKRSLSGPSKTVGSMARPEPREEVPAREKADPPRLVIGTGPMLSKP